MRSLVTVRNVSSLVSELKTNEEIQALSAALVLDLPFVGECPALRLVMARAPTVLQDHGVRHAYFLLLIELGINNGVVNDLVHIFFKLLQYVLYYDYSLKRGDSG